jgi:hypothetical protein
MIDSISSRGCGFPRRLSEFTALKPKREEAGNGDKEGPEEKDHAKEDHR